ncbi:transporter associated with antigen processing protein 1 [Actinidia rufa]|uniref:Transporter associated with antigen processing protein 1 n=1 Tax=Actinidia rufa TaxID=165716 RepID=A0A7J0EP17_9ERIC|nr:transporter associated with antigen processing protein 1 [Actinidia rufa]
MALHLCDLQPRVIYSLHHRQTSVNIHRKTETVRFAANSKVQFNFLVLRSNRRFHHISAPQSASINGFPSQSNPEKSPQDYGQTNVELSEKLRRWIGFIRSILPGGSWWSFSHDVEVVMMAKPVTVLRALQRMWELVSKDRWVIFAAFATLIITALSEISIPHFLTASIFSAQSGEIMVFHQNVRLLVLLSLTAGICRLKSCMVKDPSSFPAPFLCYQIFIVLFISLLSCSLDSDIMFFDTGTVGDLTSRLGADCQQVSRIIGNDLNMMLRNALQGTGALIYLLILSWPLGLCTLAICSTLSAIMLLYGQYQKKAAKLTQEFTASANEVAQETFSLMRTVRVYGTEKQELGRYKQWLGRLADISLRQSAAYGIWNLSFNTLYHSTQIIAVLIGGMSILRGQITAEQLTKFILYSEWLIFSTWWVGDSLSSLMQSVGASEKVGLSGSGKSTLVNLLLRLYEPTSGQILIDGFPLKDLDIKWLRERIGFVGQEPRLFRMDISSNIRYGCTRDIKQEDVEWAAKQAYAHDFIVSLPNGYKTIVDDDLLSGGQKQRIAIARAVLRDPTILILDEATSALDAESEHYVKGVLRAVKSDQKTKRAVIVIAHRLSTIQAADRIVVMDGGEIVEMGNHTELLPKDGLYARLTKRQADAVA